MGTLWFSCHLAFRFAPQPFGSIGFTRVHLWHLPFGVILDCILNSCFQKLVWDALSRSVSSSHPGKIRQLHGNIAVWLDRKGELQHEFPLCRHGNLGLDDSLENIKTSSRKMENIWKKWTGSLPLTKGTELRVQCAKQEKTFLSKSNES